MLQRITLCVLVFILLLSCSSTKDVKSMGESPLDVYFQGTVVKRWDKGLAILIDEPDPSYFGDLFYLYLSLKYEPIRDQIEDIILKYLDEFECDFNLALGEMETEEHVETVFTLAQKWEKEDYNNYIKAILISPPSPVRDYQMEVIANNLTSFKSMLSLYNSGSRALQLGVIGVAAYSREESVLYWLVGKLLDSDEEIGASALFSLSKHGSRGFKLIADNLLTLSLRLKLSAIELLTFNKEERVLLYFSSLLNTEEDLLESSVLKSFTSFEQKADSYIIDSVKRSDGELKLKLFNILKERSYNNHLRSMTELLYDIELRGEIIDLLYEKRADDIIVDLFLKKDSQLSELIVNKAMERESDLLFSSSASTDYILLYLIENLDYEDSRAYLEAIGFDDNYIRDYKLSRSIYKSLIIVRDFEKLNGEEEFVTRFFELEQNKSLADKEEESFYKGLEMWLETGDKKFLDQSVIVKNSSDPMNRDVGEQADLFLESLQDSERDLIDLYSSSKLNIVFDYKKLTYRLKRFNHDLIYQYGYQSLIE